MPARLRPTAPIAADAVLVGDPGRALLLAQDLLNRPKMSNHARGLWGYTGALADSGHRLTIQATGIGGPSAAVVLADLAELGVRRAVRVGTCVANAGRVGLGELIVVERALAAGGSAAAFGLSSGEEASPDRELTEALRAVLGDGAGTAGTVASFDSLPRPGDPLPRGTFSARDMQTVATLAHARELGVAVAAVLIVTETETGEKLTDDAVAAAAKQAGSAAALALSKPQVEG